MRPGLVILGSALLSWAGVVAIGAGIAFALSGCDTLSSAVSSLTSVPAPQTPTQQVFALKTSLQAAEQSEADVEADASIAAATKAQIKADTTVAHNAVNAAEQAVQSGASTATTLLTAAGAALTTLTGELPKESQ